MVQPYQSICTRLQLLRIPVLFYQRSDFHLIDNLSITVPALDMRLLMGTSPYHFINSAKQKAYKIYKIKNENISIIRKYSEHGNQLFVYKSLHIYIVVNLANRSRGRSEDCLFNSCHTEF